MYNRELALWLANEAQKAPHYAERVCYLKVLERIEKDKECLKEIKND